MAKTIIGLEEPQEEGRSTQHISRPTKVGTGTIDSQSEDKRPLGNEVPISLRSGHVVDLDAQAAKLEEHIREIGRDVYHAATASEGQEMTQLREDAGAEDPDYKTDVSARKAELPPEPSPHSVPREQVDQAALERAAAEEVALDYTEPEGDGKVEFRDPLRESLWNPILDEAGKRGGDSAKDLVVSMQIELEKALAEKPHTNDEAKSAIADEHMARLNVQLEELYLNQAAEAAGVEVDDAGMSLKELEAAEQAADAEVLAATKASKAKASPHVSGNEPTIDSGNADTIDGGETLKNAVEQERQLAGKTGNAVETEEADLAVRDTVVALEGMIGNGDPVQINSKNDPDEVPSDSLEGPVSAKKMIPLDEADTRAIVDKLGGLTEDLAAALAEHGVTIDELDVGDLTGVGYTMGEALAMKGINRSPIVVSENTNIREISWATAFTYIQDYLLPSLQKNQLLKKAELSWPAKEEENNPASELRGLMRIRCEQLNRNIDTNIDIVTFVQESLDMIKDYLLFASKPGCEKIISQIYAGFRETLKSFLSKIHHSLPGFLEGSPLLDKLPPNPGILLPEEITQLREEGAREIAKEKTSKAKKRRLGWILSGAAAGFLAVRAMGAYFGLSSNPQEVNTVTASTQTVDDPTQNPEIKKDDSPKTPEKPERKNFVIDHDLQQIIDGERTMVYGDGGVIKQLTQPFNKFVFRNIKTPEQQLATLERLRRFRKLIDIGSYLDGEFESGADIPTAEWVKPTGFYNRDLGITVDPDYEWNGVDAHYYFMKFKNQLLEFGLVEGTYGLMNGSPDIRKIQGGQIARTEAGGNYIDAISDLFRMVGLEHPELYVSNTQSNERKHGSLDNNFIKPGITPFAAPKRPKNMLASTELPDSGVTSFAVLGAATDKVQSPNIMAHTIDTSDIDNGWGDDIPVTLEGFAPSADTVTQLSAMGRTEAGAHFLQTGKILLPTGADAAMAVENIYIQVCENDAQIGAIDDLLKTFNINDYTAVLEDGRVYVELPDSVRADFEKALRKGTQPKVADNSPSIEVSEETISHDEWLAMQIAEQDPFQNPEEVQGAVHGRIAGLYLE